MAVTKTAARNVVAAGRPAGAIRIVRHTDAETAAVLAFNRRMAAESASTGFLLPDRPNDSRAHPGPNTPIAWTKYVALDDEQEVRGGFLLMEQPGVAAGEPVRVANYQAPISEGIRDSRFGMVGMVMLKYVQQQWPLAYVVGMGDPMRPLPRLLAAAGWTVRPVPFLFRIARPHRVLRELRPLRRRPYVRAGADAARASGLAWLGTRVLRGRAWPALWRARRLGVDRIDRWDGWVDGLWQRVEQDYAFAAIRNRAAVEQLYPLDGGACLAFVVRESGRPVGWATCLHTRMRDHEHFGDLTVGTVLDCVAEARWAPAVAVLVARELDRLGADLVITNQSHERWIRAFRESGFLIGPSNYLFAASRPLAAAIADATRRVHVTRGDGDGRIHL